MRQTFSSALILAALLLAGGCSDLGDPYEYQADCDRSTGSLDFGRVPLGHFRERTLVIANSGNIDLECNLTLPASQFSITSGAGSFSVPPGEETRVVLRYVPTDTGATYTEIDLGDGCPPVGLSGVGDPPPEGPQCVLDPPVLAFDPLKVTQTAERTFEVRNVGLIDFAVDVGVSGAGPFEIVSGAGPATLDPGDTLRVTVRFAPTATGDHNVGVAIGSTCGTLAVSGTAIPNTTVSYATQIQPIFTGRCILCHGSSLFGGLDLRAPNSYSRLVNVTSQGYAPAKRVVPGDPDASVLYNKVADTGLFGQQMPAAGGPLTVEQIQRIETWIREGANNN